MGIKYPFLLLILFVVYVSICPLSAQSPGNVSSEIQLWLKANSGTLTNSVPAADGDSVSVWQDQSGVRVNTANAATTARPIYRDNASSNINYNPVLQFNGATTSLNFGNDYIFASSDKTGVTYLAVVKPDTTTSKRYQYIYDFGHFATLGYGMYLGDDRCGFYTPNSETSSPRSDDTSTVLVHQDISFNNYRALYLNGSTSAIVYSSAAPAVLDASNINEAPTGRATSGPFTIGRQSKIANVDNNNGRYFKGRIAEVIGYSTSLSGISLQQVKSYLAIKYGITIPENYLNSSGVTVYDVSSYSNGIIGLMRDDASALLQKQSMQQDNLTRIYISSLATVQSANTGTFNSDLQSLIVGHNNQGLYNLKSLEFPTGQGIFSRLEREWKITNTNFDQSFSMEIFIDYPPVNAADLRILIDDDGDFTDAQLFNPAITYSNGYASISGIDNTMIPQNSTRYLTIVSMNSETPLPVEWISFEVLKKEEGINQLEWEVVPGSYARYQVERSGDGKDWQLLGYVDENSSSGRYIYFDKAPLTGINYYRLKETDSEGSSSYSEIKKVACTTGIRIFPNPAASSITIDAGSTDFFLVRILDMTGKLIREIKVSSEEPLHLDVSDLIPGSYIVWIEGKAYRFEKL